MSKFALKKIEEISGKLDVFMLLINGKCAFEEFYNEIESDGNFMSELRTIMTRLHEMADCKSLPKKKFRDITRKNELNKEYEIKTSNLRVYIFHEKITGRVIVNGGKKNNQKADILNFRKIKKEYFLNL
jgi:hypothetical protein